MNDRPEGASQGWWDPLMWAIRQQTPYHSSSSPVAADNAATVRTLLYGPRGEALIRQEPRRVGFRPPLEDRR